MAHQLHKTQPASSLIVAFYPNAFSFPLTHNRGMGRPARLNQDKSPAKLHCIPQWAEHRGLKQSDLVALIDVDKSTVSRWFAGHMPSESHIVILAQLFETEVAALFMPPEDGWFVSFIKDRASAERERIKKTLDSAFPRMVA